MKQYAVFLSDLTGIMARPWAEAGYACICVDWQHEGVRREPHGLGYIEYVGADIFDWEPPTDAPVKFAGAFPECTHTATSGSKHFQVKGLKDIIYALRMWDRTTELFEQMGCPAFAENPRSVISTHYRPCDYKFNPSDYGGYLPENDVHPDYPEYIPPRDGYPKETWIWAYNGFVMPACIPVPSCEDFPGWKKLGGKSIRTKNIRSATPRGFARATYIANSLVYA